MQVERERQRERQIDREREIKNTLNSFHWCFLQINEENDKIEIWDKERKVERYLGFYLFIKFIGILTFLYLPI